MRGGIITKEGQLEVPDETVANAEDGEMLEHGFDAPVSPVFLEDGGGEAWAVWGDDYLERIFAIRDLCRGAGGGLFPEDERLVHDDIGGDDIDATQSRLITPDGDSESLGRERLVFLLVLDPDDWTRVSKCGKINTTRETDSLGLCTVRVRDGQNRRNIVNRCSRGRNG